MQVRSDNRSSSLTAPKALAILVVASSILVSAGMILMGQAVGKGIESVMILHDYFTVLAVMSGAGFLGILVFGSSQLGQQMQHHPDAIKVLKVLVLTAVASALRVQ
jgi:hypothetical protein